MRGEDEGTAAVGDAFGLDAPRVAGDGYATTRGLDAPEAKTVPAAAGLQTPSRWSTSSRCALLIESYEQEQRQLACDLHDGIGQILGALKYRLEATILMAKDGDVTSVCDALSSVVTRVQDAIEEVRRVAMRLRPSLLDDLGLLPTIEWFARDFRATYAGTDLVTQVGVREEEIPEGLKLVIYRVIQEALYNVARHAHARAARVELTRTQHDLTLRIVDDGQGFDVARLPVGSISGGLGLNGMRERVEQTGGTFALQTSAGAGTLIVARWSRQATSAGQQPILDGEGRYGRRAV